MARDVRYDRFPFARFCCVCAVLAGHLGATFGYPILLRDTPHSPQATPPASTRSASCCCQSMSNTCALGTCGCQHITSCCDTVTEPTDRLDESDAVQWGMVIGLFAQKCRGQALVVGFEIEPVISPAWFCYTVMIHLQAESPLTHIPSLRTISHQPPIPPPKPN